MGGRRIFFLFFPTMEGKEERRRIIVRSVDYLDSRGLAVGNAHSMEGICLDRMV
jgi:hypothetical protein